MSASANTLKVALRYPDASISFLEFHKMAKGATPQMFSNYKLALLLFKTFNADHTNDEWLNINFNQVLTSLHHIKR
jgi:hypothetical protein